MPRRMLRRAAVLGATAHVASKHGQAKAEAAAQQEAAAAPPPAPAQAQLQPRLRLPRHPRPGTAMTTDEAEELWVTGVLETEAGWTSQKQKILSS